VFTAAAIGRASLQDITVLMREALPSDIPWPVENQWAIEQAARK
jgi:hypothetical protein